MKPRNQSYFSIILLFCGTCVGIQVYENTDEGSNNTIKINSNDDTIKEIGTTPSSILSSLSFSPSQSSSIIKTTIPMLPTTTSTTTISTPVVMKTSELLLSSLPPIPLIREVHIMNNPIQYTKKPESTQNNNNNNNNNNNDEMKIENDLRKNNGIFNMYKIPTAIVHPMSNYKKRQLFQKNQQTKDANGTNTDSNRGEKTGSSSSTNLKNFVPSPQLDSSYYDSYSVHHNYNNHNQPPSTQHTSHQDIVDFRPTTQYYKPMKFDSYYPNPTPFNFQSVNSKWFGGEKFPPNFDQSSHKLEEITPPPPPPSLPPQLQPPQQHMQLPQQPTPQMNKGHFAWQSSDNGHFIWVSDTETKPPEEEEKPNILMMKPELLNSTGKWQWIEDDDTNAEGKIISNGPTYPTYYEQIKIYQDLKTPHSFINKEHPYSFDISDTPFNYHSYFYKQNENQTEITTTIEPPKMDEEMSTPMKEMELLKQYHKSAHWKKIFQVLTAVIPIGLIVAALTPKVIYVNPNMTAPTQVPMVPIFPAANTTLSRQRSLEQNEFLRDDGITPRKMTNPLMDFLNILGNANNNETNKNTSCEDKIFCEMSRIGQRRDADVLNKMLWKIANETPEDRARQSGLGELFWAIRENRCSIYECERQTKY